MSTLKAEICRSNNLKVKDSCKKLLKFAYGFVLLGELFLER